MKTIKLTPMEMYQAGIVGLARRIDSMQRRLNGCPLNGWQIDIEGALAEMAFAKAMGVYAGLTINNYKGADIGEYHVRSSVKSDACLIIRPEDDPSAVYVLVTGAEGDYTVHGWIKGSDARNEDYWMAPNNRPGAWFVPQSALMGL